MPVPLTRALSLVDTLGVGVAALRHGPLVLGLGGLGLWALHLGRGASLLPLPDDGEPLAGLVEVASKPENLPAVLLVGLMQLAAFMLRTWIEPGYLRAQRDVVMSGRGRALALVGGVDVFLDMLLIRMLNAVVLGAPVVLPLAMIRAGVSALPATAVLALLVVASGWLAIGLQFATRFVALGDHGAGTALRRSWEMAGPHRLRLFTYDLALFGLLVIVGYLPGLMVGDVLGVLAGGLVSAVTWIAARTVTSTSLTCSYLLATRETALVYRLIEPVSHRFQPPSTQAVGRIPAPDEPITEEGSLPRR